MLNLKFPFKMSNPWSTPLILGHRLAKDFIELEVSMRYVGSTIGHRRNKVTQDYMRIMKSMNKTMRSPLDSLYEYFRFESDKDHQGEDVWGT